MIRLLERDELQSRLVRNRLVMVVIVVVVVVLVFATLRFLDG